MNKLIERQEIAGNTKVWPRYQQLQKLLAILEQRSWPEETVDVIHSEIEALNAMASFGSDIRPIHQKRGKRHTEIPGEKAQGGTHPLLPKIVVCTGHDRLWIAYRGRHRHEFGQHRSIRCRIAHRHGHRIWRRQQAGQKGAGGRASVAFGDKIRVEVYRGGGDGAEGVLSRFFSRY
jgi:hypothetical protein